MQLSRAMCRCTRPYTEDTSVFDTGKKFYDKGIMEKLPPPSSDPAEMSLWTKRLTRSLRVQTGANDGCNQSLVLSDL